MTRIDTAQEATSSRSEVYAALDKGTGLELLARVRIARKDPAALFRAVKGIVAKPAPQSRTADLGDQNPMSATSPRSREGTRELRAGAEVRSPFLHRNDEIGAKARARHTS